MLYWNLSKHKLLIIRDSKQVFETDLYFGKLEEKSLKKSVEMSLKYFKWPRLVILSDCIIVLIVLSYRLSNWLSNATHFCWKNKQLQFWAKKFIENPVIQ